MAFYLHSDVISLVLVLLYFGAELASGFRLTRSLLKLLTLFPSLLDLTISRLFKRICKPRYRLSGQCHYCGRCCRHLVDYPPAILRRNNLLARLYLWYHLNFHGFALTARGPNDEYIFSCLKLGDDNLCSDYRFRPRLCRDYPVVRYFEKPQVLQECGYAVKKCTRPPR